jgi:hypothetical protein
MFGRNRVLGGSNRWRGMAFQIRAAVDTVFLILGPIRPDRKNEERRCDRWSKLQPSCIGVSAGSAIKRRAIP